MALRQLRTIEGHAQRYEILTKGNVSAVLEKVRASYRAREFANLLISDRKVGGLFFHHWRQLSLLPSFSLPFFADTNRPIAGADSLSIEAKEAAGRSSVAFERIAAAAEPLLAKRFKAMVDRMKADGLDPETMGQEAFTMFLFKNVGFLSGDPVNALAGLIRPFEDYFADEMGDFAFELLSAIKSGVRTAGDTRTKRVLTESSLTPLEYRETISRMQEGKYLRTGLAIHWCEGHPDLPVSLVTVGDSHQVSLQCRVCSKNLVHCSFLLPTSASMIWARQYHGVLQYLLPWTLEQEGIPWATNVYLRGVPTDVEKDIVLKRKRDKGVTIVECKSDYTDSPERTVNQKLRDHLVQLSKAVLSYRRLGITVESAILATNVEASSEREESIRRWIGDDSDLLALKDTEVKLIGPNNISGWWK